MKQPIRCLILLAWIILCSGSNALFGQNDTTRIPDKSVRWALRPTGLYINASFGIVTFRGNLLTGMQAGAGYKLNPHIAFGGGIGLERYSGLPTYDTLSANFSLMPVFAEVRYTILNKPVSPFLALKGGYKVLLNIPSSQMTSWTYTVFPGFYWIDYAMYDTYTRGGLFFTAEAGVRANVWKRFNLFLSADYSLWSVSGDHHLWTTEWKGGVDTETHEISSVVAYTHIFGVRLGFGF